MIRFYQFAWKRFSIKSKFFFVLIFLTSLLNNASLIIIPIIQKKMIERVTRIEADITFIIWYCIICTIGIIAMITEAILLNSLEIHLKRVIQEELLESALKNKNKIIETKGAGAYMVSVFGDSEQIANLLDTNIVNTIFQCIAIVIILIISTRWSLVFAAVVVPTYAVMILVHIISDKIYMKKFEAGREKVYEVNPKVLECIENRLSILGFADIKKYIKKIYSLFNERDQYFKSAYAINEFANSFFSGIKTVSFSIFFIISLWQIQIGEMEISSFIAMNAYFSLIFAPILLIKQYYSNAHKFMMLYNKIGDSLRLESRLEMPQSNELALSNCSFAHKNAPDNKQLKNISIKIDKKVGVVGLSGEGKSTIIKLILGEYAPLTGRCSYGEKNISDISRYLIHSTIRYYSQDPEIFDEDLKYNITLGKEGLSKELYEKKLKEYYDLTQKTFNKLEKWNRKAKLLLNKEQRILLQEVFLLNENQLNDNKILQNIVHNLPDNKTLFAEWIAKNMSAKHYYIDTKYQNLLKELDLWNLDGRNFGQRGNRVSGGEKNKIALARFLLPEYGEYFILDEPFTSLDAISEKKCFEVLKRYTKEMKGIIISHKMNIISQFSDVICVVENGVITDQGTHDTLINESELYKKLCDEYEKKTKKEELF